MQTQNNEIDCKVQYGNEFRRFLLQGSYAAMMDQIRVLFGFKNNEDFCIKYTDDEGDLVTISSDEELGFAVELFPNSLLRLTINTVSAPQQQTWKCQRDRAHCAKWAHKNGTDCEKWTQKNGNGCNKWAPKNGNECENWAQKNGNDCDKWEKMRAEKAEFWKAKKAQKAAQKWEAKGAKKSKKWEDKGAKKSEKWEAKKACKAEKWEAKKQKFINDSELRKEKLERVESKLAKLHERKQWLQIKVDANVAPCFAHRLAFVTAKIIRLESLRAILVNPVVASSPASAPVVVIPSAPAVEPMQEITYYPNISGGNNLIYMQ